MANVITPLSEMQRAAVEGGNPTAGRPQPTYDNIPKGKRPAKLSPMRPSRRTGRSTGRR